LPGGGVDRKAHGQGSGEREPDHRRGIEGIRRILEKGEDLGGLRKAAFKIFYGGC
jgi:hypothetical protein